MKKIFISTLIILTLFSCRSAGEDVVSFRKNRKAYKAVNNLLKQKKELRENDTIQSDGKEAFSSTQFRIYDIDTYTDKQGNKKRHKNGFFSEAYIELIDRFLVRGEYEHEGWRILKEELDRAYIAQQATNMNNGTWDIRKFKKYTDTVAHTRNMSINNLEKFRKERISIRAFSLPIISKNGRYMLIRESWSYAGYGSEQTDVYKKEGKNWEYWFTLPGG